MYLILPASSSITYTVEITNKVSDSYLIDSIEEISNTNNNIGIDVSLNVNDVVEGNSTKTFTITLTNETDSEQHETLVIEYGFKLNSFTVTFDADGGSVETSSKQVSYGSTYGTLPTPTRNGYKFLGWNGSNMINIDNDESLPSSTGFILAEKRTFIPNSHVFGLAYNNYYNHYDAIKESYTKTGTQISFTKTPGYGIAYPFISDARKIYTISYETSGGMISVMYYKNDGTIITYDLKNEQGKNNYTFTTFPNTYYLVIALVSDGDNNPEFKNIKLVEGDIVTELEPYYITSSTTVVQPKNHTLTAQWLKIAPENCNGDDIVCINNYNDLVTLRDEVNAGDSKLGKTFFLTTDIDMGGKFDSNGTMLDGSTNWTPIGTESNPFSGTFDGDGHIITNLYINKSGDYTTGLFGYITNSTIKNMGIEDSYIINTDNNSTTGAAAFIAYGSSSTIESCYNKVTVVGKKFTGGLVSRNVSIKNSYNAGRVSSSLNQFAGGISGYNNCQIKNSYNIGEIFNSGSNAGGIIGGSSGGGVVNTYNLGSIDALNSGGIIGQLYSYGSVTNSYSSGSFSNSNINHGGVVGDIYTNGNQLLSNNYYLNTTAQYGIFYSDNDNYSSYSDNNTMPLSSSEMPSVISIINGDNAFVSDTNNINNGYPILKWQANRN